MLGAMWLISKLVDFVLQLLNFCSALSSFIPKLFGIILQFCCFCRQGTLRNFCRVALGVFSACVGLVRLLLQLLYLLVQIGDPREFDLSAVLFALFQGRRNRRCRISERFKVSSREGVSLFCSFFVPDGGLSQVHLYPETMLIEPANLVFRS